MDEAMTKALFEIPMNGWMWGLVDMGSVGTIPLDNTTTASKCKFNQHCYHEQTGIGSFKCCRCPVTPQDIVEGD